jgi:DnaJ homolog subfamily B member 12
VIGKAFSILNDPQKRSIYDSSGSDPDSRGGGGGGGFSPGFSNFRHANAGFGGDEMSPEEIFNFFFGGGQMGGMGGMPMGGRGFTFVGPGGVRFQSFGGGRGGGLRRNVRRDGDGDDVAGGWVRFLPVIILVLFSLLGSFGR